MSPAPHDDFRPAAWIADLRCAGRLLTRLPLPGEDGPSPRGGFARAMRAYPLVGGLVGLAAGLALLGCAALGLPPPAAAILALAVAALLTGALHEDGLADTADAFGARRPAAERLAIMRDSRIGTYGALALAFALALKATALTALAPPAACAALVAAGALSRATLAGVVHLLPPARSDGLGAALGRPTTATTLLSLLLGLAVALAAVGPATALRLAPVAIVAAAGMALLARRQVGGYTGDVLGATQQVTETAMLLALSADSLATAHWIGQP